MEHEGGFLYAKDCVKYKLADVIIPTLPKL